MKHHWLLIALTAIAVTSAAHAQDGEGGHKATVIGVPPRTIIVCNVAGTGNIVIVLDNGETSESPVSAEGSATLESQGPAYTEQDHAHIAAGNPELVPASTAYSLQDLTISGIHEQLGAEYSFSLDPDRPAATSSIRSNQPDADFPATASIYANVTGSVGGLSGTFTNTTECHIGTTNLSTFSPQVNEVYQFVQDVVFSNGEGTTFTIPAGSTVTLN
jgi:hypothetical protein